MDQVSDSSALMELKADNLELEAMIYRAHALIFRMELLIEDNMKRLARGKGKVTGLALVAPRSSGPLGASLFYGEQFCD